MKDEIVSILSFAWKFTLFILVLLFITGRLGGIIDRFKEVPVKQGKLYFSSPWGIKETTFKDTMGRLPKSAYIDEEEFNETYR